VNDPSDQQLLRDYAAGQSEAAFTELVRRHVDLVFSAARRMTGEEQSARDATQAAFIALAQNASRLTPHPVLSGWLHCTVRNLAAKSVRTEVRRRAREQEAAMNELPANEPEPMWEQVAPLLDAALDELSEPDRDALLLRYFERKSAREMAQTLGVSDEAAQKRVTRALERLRELLARRGVAAGASGLAAVISANAVQAAPAGLAATISAATVVAGTTLAATLTTTTTKAIAMTTLQKTLVTATVAVLAGAAIYQARQTASLRHQNEILLGHQAALTEQVVQLRQERDAGTQRLTAIADELASIKNQPTEVHKLRGQVGVLRQEKEAIGSKSALSKITADPETRRMMREQQKMGMSSIYGELVKRWELTPELTGQFNDLLADHIMANIEQITQALHDNTGTAEINQTFSAQDAALHERLRALIGAEGLEEYRDYTKRLLATVTASQFESSLTGDPEVKAGKKRQFQQAIQEEVQLALATAGLPADYQTIPMLNLRNIASEEQGEFGLRLMDGIYAAAAARAGLFLNEAELKAFGEFRTKAQDNNRTLLSLNRKMMAPIAK